METEDFPTMFQNPGNKKLKVGLIVDSEFASKYVHELATWGQIQHDVIISHLIIQKTDNPLQGPLIRLVSSLKKNGVTHIIRQLFFYFIIKTESTLLSIIGLYKDHLSSHDLSKVVKKSIEVKPLVSKSGFVFRYSEEDINKIKNIGLDVLIRCGSGILRGGILEASRFGVLSFHHGDNRVNRGGPPGFWEVYFKERKTGFIIQQLTEELDGGNVLVRGGFPTQFFYLLNQAFLYTKSNYYMKLLLNNIATAGKMPDILPAVPYFNPLFIRPVITEQFYYLFNICLTFGKKFINKRILKKYNRWGVAYIKSDWKNLVMWRAKRIQNPPGHFLADPFLIHEKDRDYCFVEDYDYRISKACISVYELNDITSARLGEAISEPFHMSFPFIFRFDSKIFICPETSANKDIRIYECTGFPLNWRLSKILMKDVWAADTMIFEHNKRWWLFTNIDPSQTGDHCSELYIFHSDNPLSETWLPHPKNPVYIDSSKGRNAGIVYDAMGNIYRVAQRQGFDLYGEGFSINKITVLDTEIFAEAEICSIDPHFFPGIFGTHHLHSNGTFSVFDFLEASRIDK